MKNRLEQGGSPSRLQPLSVQSGGIFKRSAGPRQPQVRRPGGRQKKGNDGGLWPGAGNGTIEPLAFCVTPGIFLHAIVIG
jgi:hypothetical protein